MSRQYPRITLLRNRGHWISTALRRTYLRRVWGMDIGEGVRISMSAKLDKTHPRGISIGDYTAVAYRASVLTHDFVNSRHLDTRIGSNTFIGAGAVVMPGVTIGDGCIVSALSVVARDVPSGSVVMGNPARIVEKDIVVGKWGNRVEVEAG